MTTLILDGRTIAKEIRAELRAEIATLSARRGHPPTLAVLQVQGDAASERYVRVIRKMCEEAGAGYLADILPATASQAEIEQAVASLSANPAVDGLIVQLPLPAGIDSTRVIARIDPRKDIDGVTPDSAGLLMLGQPGLRPNTPAGGMELLRRYGIELKGKRAVVVGRSTIVGRPMALMLLHEHATVTIAHSRTPDLATVIRSGELVVAAVGKAGMITADMLKPGAVVVDFGINMLVDGSMVGDVAADAAAVASAITPVPGGTGPMTNAMLLGNLVQAARG
jgi:methylenetetrahydrofolate dehydrogenase (NADP+) / methenyltetrahydrofolate cyclohydrolase